MDIYYKIHLLYLLSFFKTFSGVIVEFSFSTTTIGNQVHSGSTPDILNLAEHLEKYGIEGSKITSFKFQVKAGKDANVFLSSSTTMDSAMPFYDVNLGAHSNTKTQLVRRHDYTLSTTQITKEWKADLDRHRLKSTEFRDFWVSWDGGIIKHGRGPVVGDDIIGEWADPNPFPVKSIGVLNSFNTQGDWIIHVTAYGNASTNFINCSPSTERVDLNVYKPVMMLSETLCAMQCKADEQCMGFNYKNNSCELLSFGPGVITAIPKVSANGWRFFTKCYVKRNACFDCLL